MQWADLRGLSSSIGRGAARMTTTAARQRLPLLPLPRASASVLTPRWRPRPYAGWVRPFSVGAQRNADDNPSWKQSKPRPPTLFEELFPDGDITTPRRGGGRHHGGASTATQKDDGDGKVKVRFLTSTTDGKSDSAEYKQSVFEHKQKSRLAEREAPANIASILESRSPAAKAQAGTVGDERPSIFTELFSAPEPTPGAAAGGRSQAEKQLYEDRHINHDDLQSWLDSLPKSDPAAADNGNATTATSSSSPSSSSSTAMVDRSAMLILSNASPNLQESDFYRIGPQGHHLDGWSTSIRKVMQAYDYSTLEPMGRYFILFDSYAAAASYQKEAQRRHAAVRRSLLSPAAPLTSISASHAEAGGSAASIFTLAPPSRAPLSLHIYKLDRATEARLGTFSIQGLLSMTPEPPPRANSHVILSVDGGTIDQRMLTYWLRRDARERNLGWPVQHMRPYFALKVDSRAIAPGDNPDADESEWRYGDDDDAPPPLVDSEGQQRGGGVPDENASSARFVLSFPDVHEARRFVRAWHRKEFVLSNGSTVTLNTHVVW